MKILHKLAFAILAASFSFSTPAYAKKKIELTPLQIQEMQSHEVEASKEVAFSSVMSVLQDSGYRINSADKDTGLITATASTNTKATWMPFIGFGSSKKTPVVSAFVETYGPVLTKVRLNFVMVKSSANSFGAGQDEEPILDPTVYRDAFEKIEQAVFIRAAAQGPAAPAVTPQPVSTEGSN